jgi:hypothetical protein
VNFSVQDVEKSLTHSNEEEQSKQHLLTAAGYRERGDRKG